MEKHRPGRCSWHIIPSFVRNLLKAVSVISEGVLKLLASVYFHLVKNTFLKELRHRKFCFQVRLHARGTNQHSCVAE